MIRTVHSGHIDDSSGNKFFLNFQWPSSFEPYSTLTLLVLFHLGIFIACQNLPSQFLPLFRAYSQDSNRYVTAVLQLQSGFALPSGNPHRLRYESPTVQYCHQLVSQD